MYAKLDQRRGGQDCDWGGYLGRFGGQEGPLLSPGHDVVHRYHDLSRLRLWDVVLHIGVDIMLKKTRSEPDSGTGSCSVARIQHDDIRVGRMGSR